LFSGCSELGTGSSTGLLQIMAEELDISLRAGKARIARYEPPHRINSCSSGKPDDFRRIRARSVRPRAEARMALVELATKKNST